MSLLQFIYELDAITAWPIRMILLHGPPGTGKTTILKGLAQKTFIRNSDRFQSGVLLEVNSHSLFSKWFSESGKLVMKLFSHISDIAEDEDCLVIVLIDEVESITSSRANAGLGNEPGDAVRVVNAVLTSLGNRCEVSSSARQYDHVFCSCWFSSIRCLEEAHQCACPVHF